MNKNILSELRKIRDQLSKKYLKGPQFEDKDLSIIKKKYASKFMQNKNTQMLKKAV